jgi:flavin reductase (DIM6/NTAB) family NADH-FMN oxidoreductase RutF
MTQAIVPRPIAWVLTRSKGGVLNLAPFSYFNAISSEPPLVMISVGKRENGLKDTARNILETRFCVIHIASQNQEDVLQQSASELDFEDSELRLLGIQESDLSIQKAFPLPRLPFVNLALNCELYEHHSLGDSQQNIIYLRIGSIVVNRNITRKFKSRIEIDPLLLDPLARLGAGLYTGIAGTRKAKV